MRILLQSLLMFPTINCKSLGHNRETCIISLSLGNPSWLVGHKVTVIERLFANELDLRQKFPCLWFRESSSERLILFTNTAVLSSIDARRFTTMFVKLSHHLNAEVDCRRCDTACAETRSLVASPDNFCTCLCLRVREQISASLLCRNCYMVKEESRGTIY